MSNFDYKKYSLENLEKWMSDALTSAEATPQEIYDVIKGVVDEEYHYFKNQTSRCYELLALLNGNGNQIIEQVKSQGELWDKEDIEAILKEREYYDGWDSNTSDMSKEEHKLTCDKDDKSPECKKAWNDFWEENYYPKEHSQYTEEELNAMCDSAEKEDKVVRWQLPVEVDGLSGDCYVNLPDDLLEAANLKEGDTVKWIDRKDGSFELRKVNGIK